MGILAKTVNQITPISASVSGSNMRLITNRNFAQLSSAINSIITELGIDNGPTPTLTSLRVNGNITGYTLGIGTTFTQFTVNGSGQVQAAGGVYSPVVNTAQIRLTPLAEGSAWGAGQIQWTGSDFVGWTGSTWASFTSGGSAIHLNTVTYSELVTLINTSALSPLGYYLISDYQTVHYIQWTGPTPSPPTQGGEDIHVGATEPIVVQATSVNTIGLYAMSPSFPHDIIYYIPTGWSDRDHDAVFAGMIQSKGVITKRIDTVKRLERDYDWRNFIFRRWETVPSNGVYRSIYPVVGSDYIDMTPFSTDPSVSQLSTRIGSDSDIVEFFSQTPPYFADNFVILNSCGNNNIAIAYGGTYLAEQGGMINNDIKFWYMSDILGYADTSFYSNNINYIYNVTIGGSLSGNTINILKNTNISGDIINNNCFVLGNCTNNGSISNNNINTIEYLSHNGGLSWSNGNVIAYTQGNTDFSSITFNLLQDIIIVGENSPNEFLPVYNHSFNSTHQNIMMMPTADMGNFEIPTQSLYDKGSGGYNEIWYSNCVMNCTPISVPITSPQMDIIF